MKTEMKKVYVFVREQSGVQSVEVTTNKYEATQCMEILKMVSAPMCEMEIEIPSIDSAEAAKILSGVLLDTLIAERQKLQADTQVKINQLDTRIGELLCLELSPEVSNNE